MILSRLSSVHINSLQINGTFLLLTFSLNCDQQKLDKNYALKYDITIETLKTKIINKQNDYQTIVGVMEKDFNCTLINIDYENELSMIDYFIEKIKSA